MRFFSCGNQKAVAGEPAEKRTCRHLDPPLVQGDPLHVQEEEACSGWVTPSASR